MISTVTTSTVSTVATMAIAGSFGLIGILCLFALLIQKEVVTSSESTRLKALGKLLNIAILPLVVAFVMIVVDKLAQILK